MATFESWATAVSDAIEDKLGFKNVKLEIFEDHAIWASRQNRGVARPDEDGLHVTVIFDHGAGHRYELRTGAADAAEEITGRLIGI
jgi:hypothetical protein